MGSWERPLRPSSPVGGFKRGIIKIKIEWQMVDEENFPIEKQIAIRNNNGINLFKGIKIFCRLNELLKWNQIFTNNKF